MRFDFSSKQYMVVCSVNCSHYVKRVLWLLSSSLLALTSLQSQQTLLVGRVVDTSGHAIAYASVHVQASTTGALTNRYGRFTLSVNSREFQLRVKRIGYRERVVNIDLVKGEIDSVEIVMTESSAELRSVVVNHDAIVPLSFTATPSMVRQQPALGEADMLRALPLVPTVSQPNDILNRFHLAGGASDEHSYSLDGHPLQSPLHAASILGSFNAASIERMDIMVHHIPAAHDGYLSGNVQLQTLRPRERPHRELVVSMLSASATVTQKLPQSVDALISVRATYVDHLLGAMSSGSAEDMTFPGYNDVLVRLGKQWKNNVSFEALGFSTKDAGDRRNSDGTTNDLSLGETLLGATVGYTNNEWTLAVRGSRNVAHVEAGNLGSSGIGTISSRKSRILQEWWSGSLEIERKIGDKLYTKVGSSYRLRNHSHKWNERFAREILRSSSLLVIDTLSKQRLGALFVESTFIPSSLWQITAGTTVSRYASSGTYFAPRLLLSRSFLSQGSLDFAYNRRNQFDAVASEPNEPGATLPVFFLESPRTVDVIAASAKYRTGSSEDGRGYDVSATLYKKYYHNRTVVADTTDYISSPFNDPLILPTVNEPDFSRLSAKAHGASVTLAMSASSGVALSANYNWQKSLDKVDNRYVPTAWDMPHQFSGYLAYPLSKRLLITGLLQLHSGRVVTPVISRILAPSVDRYIYGDERSAYLPMYRRLDVGSRYSWRGIGADWTASLQIINALHSTNAIEYSWISHFTCEAQKLDCGSTAASKRGLPIIPSVGLEIVW